MVEFKSKLIHGTTYILIFTVMGQFFHLTNSIVLARFLGPENYGLFSILLNMNGIIGALAVFAMPPTLSKFIAQYKVENKNMMELVISNGLILVSIFSLTSVVIYFAISDIIATKLYNEPVLGLLIKISTISIILSSFWSFFSSFLRGFQKFKLTGWIGFIFNLTILPVMLIFVLKMNLVGAVIAYLISNLITFYIALKFARNVYGQEGIKFKFTYDRDIIIKMLKFALPLFLSSFVLLPAQWIVNTNLALTHGFKEVGLSKASFVIYTAVLLIPNAISNPLQPLVSELNSADPKKLPNVISKVLRFVMLISIPLVVSGMLGSKLLILTFFGVEYVNAWFFLYLLLINIFLSALWPITNTFLQGVGKSWQIFALDLGAAVMYVVFSVLLIPSFGLIGLGMAYLLQNLFIGIIELSYIRIKFNIKLNYLLTPALVIIIFMSISYLILAFTQDIISIALSGLTLILLLILEYKILTKNEKEMLINIIEKIIIRTKNFKSKDIFS